jgi:hypothetical protein
MESSHGRAVSLPYCKVSHQNPASGTATSFAFGAVSCDFMNELCMYVDMPPAEVPETMTSVAVDKNL